ncbi:MAG TPA: Ig-like domain-containing protein [Acetobacteraceae bacterium]|nr:Ig-like domain-containing protein [Acetobacteraceae bacterium]
MSGSINSDITIAATPAPVPVVLSDAPAEVGFGQSVVIGTIDALSQFNPLSVVFVGDAPQGTLSINAQDEVIYTAPGTLQPGEADSFTYEIEDAVGGVSAPVSVALALDPGPTATDPNLVVGHGGTLDLSSLVDSLALPGLTGDTLTLTGASAANGEIVQTKAGDFIYEPIAPSIGNPITVGYDLMGEDATQSGGAGTVGYDVTDSTKGSSSQAFGSDTITYTVTDQLGDTVTGTASVTVDPGPSATDPTLVVGHGGTLDLSSAVGQLAIPGLKADTLTLTAASAADGTIVQTKGGDLVYEAFSSSSGSPTTVGYDLTADDATGTGGPDTTGYDVTGNGTGAGKTAGFSSDTVTYTVTDQLGDTVTGTATIDIDPGPSATDPSLVIGHAGTIDLSTMASELATPGLGGDTLTVTAVSAASGTIVQNAAGDFIYEPPAVSTTNLFGVAVGAVPGNSDIITYTVADQYGDTVTGTAAVTIDPGPTVAPGQLVVGHGQTVNLASTIEGLITPGLPGDTETITGITAQQSKISDFGGAIDYTAPAGGNDTVTFNVKDSNGDTATGSIAITIDPGPTAIDPTLVVGHGGTLDLSSMASQLATPGLIGDTLTVTAASAQAGTIVQNKAGDFVYEPIAAANGSPTTVGYDLDSSTIGVSTKGIQAALQDDIVTYTVQDQAGDTVTGTADIAVDPGPTVLAGQTIVASGHTVNLTGYLDSLILPGFKGDTETITSVNVQTGEVSLGNAANGAVTVEYTAPAGGGDTLTFGVQDQYGDTATGTVAISVDPGPTAGNVSADVQVGQSIDLTQQILGADKPGFAGDTLSLVADGTEGTTGSVSLVDGDLVYTASNAAFASLGAGASASDSFTYTVSDQYGDQATGTVTLDVSNPVATVNGSPYGNAVLQGPAGNAVINASGWGNTIYANGGNDTINAGQGSATVNAGSGNVTVNLNGYNNVVTGGDGADSVAGSLGNTSVTLGNGNDTVDLAGYGNAITVGNGNDTIAAGAGSDIVVAGSGTDTVSLAGYSDSVTLTGGTDTVTGGAGDETYDLTGGSASLALNGYGNMVFLHSTNATIVDAGQGTAIDIAGGGTDVIQGAGSDSSLLVDLTGGLGGYTSAASVIAALTPDGHGGALLSLGASHGSVDFAGVAPAMLHASNFQVG